MTPLKREVMSARRARRDISRIDFAVAIAASAALGAPVGLAAGLVIRLLWGAS